MRIAFGLNRREKEFSGLDIYPGKFFIDTKESGQLEREAMLHTVKKGVTVVVLSMADLGRGAGQVSIVKAIESAGGSIEVREAPKLASQPLPEKGLTDAQEAEICRVWGNKALSEETRLIRIKEFMGHEIAKAQVYYICVTKLKRAAAKANRKDDE